VTRDPNSGKALSVGSEGLMIIAVEREGEAPILINYDWLAQPGLMRMRGAPSHLTERIPGKHAGFRAKLFKSVLARRGTRAGFDVEGPKLESVDIRIWNCDVAAPGLETVSKRD